MPARVAASHRERYRLGGEFGGLAATLRAMESSSRMPTVVAAGPARCERVTRKEEIA